MLVAETFMQRTLWFVAGLALASFLPVQVIDHTAPASAAPVMSEDEPKADALARKRKKIEELMVAMDQREVAKQSLAASLKTFGEMGLSDEFKSCFEENFDLDHLLELMVDVYADNLEESTVDALLAFQRTEEGKNYAKALPSITVQAMEKGAEYGKQVGGDCAKGR